MTTAQDTTVGNSETMRKVQVTFDNSEICSQTQFIRSDGVKCWISNHLPCDEYSESCLWCCTVCGGLGTVGRCCGKETREPYEPNTGGES